MKRIYLFLACILGLALLAQAHEFWLQPNAFFAQPGEVVPIEVVVGEYFQGEPSEGRKNRIVHYTHWSGSTKEEITPIRIEGHYGLVSLPLSARVTHLITLADTNKYLEMRADSFLLYLQEDGLTQVIQWRKQHNQTQKHSREFYRRYVKTLIQIGPLTVQDHIYSQNTGMPLEIIPAQNPHSLKPGLPLRFTIVFDIEPLLNALVRYWNQASINNLALAHFTEQQQRTNAKGQVQFPLKAGNNMISLCPMPTQNRLIGKATGAA